MTHDYHESLPGYSPGQLLHAGCGECDRRAASMDGGIGDLDKVQFQQAWRRAWQWQASASGGLPDLDRAEMRMLSALWAVQVQLEKFGVPLGTLPVATW